MTTHRAAQDRVLVLLDKPEDHTASGIIIPATALEKSVKGTVLSVGSDIKDENIKKDAKVLLANGYAGALVTDKGGDHVVACFEGEIVALLG